MNVTRPRHVHLRRAAIVFVLAAALFAPLSAERAGFADLTVGATYGGGAELKVRAPYGQPASRPTIAQILKPGLPIELVSAKKADRLAWIAYEEGRRNVFTAAGPMFRPVRVTSFMDDDGVDVTQVRISDDGSTIAFVRGHAANNVGWVANPAGDPAGGDRAIWAVRTATPGVATRLAEGQNPEVSPDGRQVLYLKDGQIYRARVGAAAPTQMDRGEVPFIRAWGRNSGPRWSPDGTRIAFSSDRVTHSFIGIYDFRTRRVTYLDASVDRDTSPTWSADGKQIAFLRRPGSAFGQQPSPGGGSGMPAAGEGRGGRAGGAAAAPGGRGAAPVFGRGDGRGGRGDAQGQQPAQPSAPLAQQPGLYRGLLPGGHSLALMVADAATGTAKSVWHPEPNSGFETINNIQWANDVVIFTRLAKPTDESNSYYSLSLSGKTAPIQLTTTEGIIEDATAAALSKDGKTLFYCTNAGDIDRRHIWAVPTTGGQPHADHDGRRHGERACAAVVRQADRRAQCRCEAAALSGTLAGAADTGDCRSEGAEGRSTRRSAGFPARRAGRADQRHAQGGRRRRVPQPVVPAEGLQAGRAAAGAHLRARRSARGRCCSAATT